MAVTATPACVQNPKLTPITIVAADTTAKKTVATAGANGMKVVGLTATSDDTSARIVQIFHTRSATNYLLGSVNVPTLAGTDGSAPVVNLFNSKDLPGLPVDNDGQRYVLLESGDTLTVATTTTVTAAKTVTVVSQAGNF